MSDEYINFSCRAEYRIPMSNTRCYLVNECIREEREACGAVWAEYDFLEDKINRLWMYNPNVQTRILQQYKRYCKELEKDNCDECKLRYLCWTT